MPAKLNSVKPSPLDRLLATLVSAIDQFTPFGDLP